MGRLFRPKSRTSNAVKCHLCKQINHTLNYHTLLFFFDFLPAAVFSLEGAPKIQFMPLKSYCWGGRERWQAVDSLSQQGQGWTDLSPPGKNLAASTNRAIGLILTLLLSSDQSRRDCTVMQGLLKLKEEAIAINDSQSWLSVVHSLTLAPQSCWKLSLQGGWWWWGHWKIMQQLEY